MVFLLLLWTVDIETPGDLISLVQKFFSPPLPDPLAVTVSAAGSISNNNNDLRYKSESDNDEPSVRFNMDTPDTSPSQLETHIARLKTAADLNSDADLDIEIGSDGDIHNNTTIIVDDLVKCSTQLHEEMHEIHVVEKDEALRVTSCPAAAADIEAEAASAKSPLVDRIDIL
ncbi:hypothetical protein HJC23_011536 [Cyclotella cryptica]|uniref:Uncharacterized protein n=1 Tax=Cyclotella cryptica TaxID=29204 RepID=A0ABD3PZE8_9STRA